MQERSVTPLARKAALERAVMRVRWFGVALGVYETVWYVPNPGTALPSSASVIALTALGVMFAANVALAFVLRTERSARTLHGVGAVMFSVDIATLWALVWAFSFEPFGNTWVILTILPLEGALRYQHRGAMVPVALAGVLEPVRDLVRVTTLPGLEDVGLSYMISGSLFRIGIIFIIGAVAGAMARTMEQTRAAAEERSIELAELAAREARARRESNAFQHVILAGVSAAELSAALDAMLEAIAADLGYERLGVLLRDGDQLAPVAVYGFHEDVRRDSVRVGEGIAGRVVEEGRTMIVADVGTHPHYYAVDETTRSQITLPITVDHAVIGVLDVESSRPAAFDEEDKRRLERLCEQMALVIHNARLLAEQRETVGRLRELDMMKSDFIAIASHELRTPLTAMQGSIKTLARSDDLDRSTREELLKILDRQSSRLGRLVEDLLLASGVDAGYIPLRMDTARLEEVVDDVLEELGPTATRVSVALSETIPPIVTDAQRLGQIVRNIVENALKFSPPETSVRLTAHESSGTLTIDIADEGSGIPHRELPHIFDRFHQVGGSMRRRSDGLGLGLYIAKRLTQALGGVIEVDSKQGRGTTFHLRLPLADARDTSAIA